MTETPKLTLHQIEVLKAAYKASDGWLMRGASAVWYRAPTAISACVRKGLLEMPRHRGRARLTPEGRALVEADPRRFGIAGRRA